VIGGYLGSGKTTFVNRLLAGGLPGRTAVVVNDFGSVNIDAELVASADEDTIELSNGCICCQLSDDASRTMTALAARSDLDTVICEVSGVGDPGELALWRSYPGFAPGPVIVCADATDIERRLRDEYVGDTVAKQLASAEIVLLTKTDLASPVQLLAAEQLCHQAAPQAQVVAQDPMDPTQTVGTLFANQTTFTERLTEIPADEHFRTHSSLTVMLDEAVDAYDLARVLEGHSSLLARAKGIVWSTGSHCFEVQFAAGRGDVEPHNTGFKTARKGHLVLIAAGPESESKVNQVADELTAGFGARRMPPKGG